MFRFLANSAIVAYGYVGRIDRESLAMLEGQAIMATGCAADHATRLPAAGSALPAALLER